MCYFDYARQQQTIFESHLPSRSPRVSSDFKGCSNCSSENLTETLSQSRGSQDPWSTGVFGQLRTSFSSTCLEGSDAEDCYTARFENDSDDSYLEEELFESPGSTGLATSRSIFGDDLCASCSRRVADLACDPVWVDDARSRIKEAALAVVEAQQAAVELSARADSAHYESERPASHSANASLRFSRNEPFPAATTAQDAAEAPTPRSKARSAWFSVGRSSVSEQQDGDRGSRAERINSTRRRPQIPKVSSELRICVGTMVKSWCRSSTN
ncbi:hypothetical protein CLOM_g24483 [Closterium sp. NIES-68]|nr:hypothetical protein CLOM_g24483 [Closterium sp. NIES-68]GJP85076.1 hypothetical protein CLOP_g15177 [Closterium sp. NIES-67]